MNKLSRLLAISAMAGALMFTGNALAYRPAKAAPAAAAQKATASPAPTDKEIADAQAKGLVWVNTSTKIYHKNGKFYGKTKHGKFMTEADAQKAGYKVAKR